MPINFKNIKSLFIVEDEEFVKKASSANPEVKKTEDGGKPEVAKEHVVIDTGKISDKFTNILFSAMEGQNLPGIDYLEYRQSLKSLEKMPMEEAVRYQSAFAMAQAMGAVPQKLIDSANHYLEVLKGENAKFNQSLLNQKKEQITNRETNIQQLNTGVQQKEDQIKKLTAEIDKHKAEIEKLKQDISDADIKLKETSEAFIATYGSITAQILQDVENMKKFLK
jgi:uncharacterized coiled-coil DUF342 family protein